MLHKYEIYFVWAKSFKHILILSIIKYWLTLQRSLVEKKKINRFISPVSSLELYLWASKVIYLSTTYGIKSNSAFMQHSHHLYPNKWSVFLLVQNTDFSLFFDLIGFPDFTTPELYLLLNRFGPPCCHSSFTTKKNYGVAMSERNLMKHKWNLEMFCVGLRGVIFITYIFFSLLRLRFTNVGFWKQLKYI